MDFNSLHTSRRRNLQQQIKEVRLLNQADATHIFNSTPAEVDVEAMLPSAKNLHSIKGHSSKQDEKPHLICKIPLPPLDKLPDLSKYNIKNSKDHLYNTISEKAHLPQNNDLKLDKPISRKRKKKRFRNLYASSDDEIVPSTEAVVIKDSSNSSTTKCAMIDGFKPKLETQVNDSNISLLKNKSEQVLPAVKTKQKVHILEEYIFPSPKTQQKTPFLKKQPIRKAEPELEHDQYLSDDSVSSIKSKISVISGTNLNGSQDLGEVTDGTSSQDSSFDVIGSQSSLDLSNVSDTPLPEENIPEDEECEDLSEEIEVGQRFWAMDDLGQLCCLEKSENGLILVPEEELEVEEEEEENPMVPYSENPQECSNNNSLQIESKEVLYSKQEEKVVEEENESQDEELNHSIESINSIDYSEDDGMSIENEEDLLADDVGNEEIIGESPQGDSRVASPPLEPASEEPVYVINDIEPDEIKQIAAVTPLEYAFVKALNDLREADTPMSVALNQVVQTEQDQDEDASNKIPETAVTFTPIKTDLETLLRVQDQCSIEEYHPNSDSDYSDYSLKTEESLNSIDKISQADIAKIILGEGFGARLVTDEEQAMDLLDLPPGYSPKPIVFKPLVPVTISSVIPDNTPATETKQKKPKGLRAKPKPFGVKRRKMKSTAAFTHVTGDSEFLSPKHNIGDNISQSIESVIMSNTSVSDVTNSKGKKISKFVSSRKSKVLSSSLLLPRKRGRPKKNLKSPSKFELTTSTPNKVKSEIMFSPLEQKLRMDHNLSDVSVSICLDKTDTDRLSLEYDKSNLIDEGVKNEDEIKEESVETKEVQVQTKDVRIENVESCEIKAESDDENVEIKEENVDNSEYEFNNLINQNNSSFIQENADASVNLNNNDSTLKTSPRKAKKLKKNLMPGRKMKRLQRTRIRWSGEVEPNHVGSTTEVLEKIKEENKEQEVTTKSKATASPSSSMMTRTRSKQKLEESPKKTNNDLSVNNETIIDLESKEFIDFKKTSDEPEEVVNSYAQEEFLKNADLQKSEPKQAVEEAEIKSEVDEDRLTEEQSPDLTYKSMSLTESTASIRSLILDEEIIVSETEKVKYQVFQRRRRSSEVSKKPTEVIEKRQTRSSSSRRSEVMGLCSKYLVMQKSSDLPKEETKEEEDDPNTCKSDMEICSDHGDSLVDFSPDIKSKVSKAKEYSNLISEDHMKKITKTHLPKKINISPMSLSQKEIAISIGNNVTPQSDNKANDKNSSTRKSSRKNKKRHGGKSLEKGATRTQLFAETSIVDDNKSISHSSEDEITDVSIKTETEDDTDVSSIKSEVEDDSYDVTSTTIVPQKRHKGKKKKSKKSKPKIPKININSLIAKKKADEALEKTQKHEKKNNSAKHSPKIKIKFGNIETPSQSDILEHEIKIEPEEEQNVEDNEDNPKVPKLILKLSPHKSPTIMKSPEKEQDSNSSNSKQKFRKRKILSPIIIKSPGNENSTKNNGSPKKQKKRKVSDVIFIENKEEPRIILTDDPEVIININKENTNANPVTMSPILGMHDQENLENLEVKEELEEDYIDETYQLGDLVLARLGSFCFWPCMIAQDITTDFKFVQSNSKTVRYHVRFFGDNGRRAWLPKANIIPYKGINTLELHKEELTKPKQKISKGEKLMRVRDINACKMSSRVYKAWKIGMDEAESLVHKTAIEKEDFFTHMFNKPKGNKRKRKTIAIKEEPDDKSSFTESTTSSDEVTVKKENDNQEQEQIESKSPQENIKVVRASKKRKLDNKVSSTSPSVQKSNKLKSNKTPSTLETTDGNKRRRSINKQPEAEKNANKDINNVSLEQAKRNYVLEDLELINRGSLMQEAAAAVVLKVEPEATVITQPVEKLSAKSKSKIPRFSSDSKKIEMVKNLKVKTTNDGASEISDTDSSTKISSQSTGTKRVLFKDVPRLPVCQICFKNDGIVLKCKGSCFCFYHPTCFQVKEEPTDEVTETSIDKVQIVDIKTKNTYFDKKQVNLNESDVFNDLDLIDQLDNKLQKVMAGVTTVYHGSTTDTGDSEDGANLKSPDNLKSSKKLIEDNFICMNCIGEVKPPCHACGNLVYLEKYVDRFKCSVNGCGRYFHEECLKCWPQTVIKSTLDDPKGFIFTCPMHNCQTCISDNPKACTTSTSLPIVKQARCLKCPATYHINSFCIPAGTQLLSHTQIICPRHVDHKTNKRYIINANWCFICSEGGDLLCCETCPTSVHQACISINLRADDTFVCEDCESGRLPLYDDIVWAKFSYYKWWPGVVLFPEDVPESVRHAQHRPGEFVVKFYGTHDHHWFALGRVFLFQEDDRSETGLSTSRRDIKFQLAIQEAREALIMQKELRKRRELTNNKKEKPSKFIKIKVNRYIGNVKPYDGNVSTTNPCTCDADAVNPCGPDSDCLNRLLRTECDPEVCPAKVRCLNQLFESRKYPPLVPMKTETRGWGLSCTEPLVKGQFVIEYVGEVIDQEEYQRRIKSMSEKKTENYYFLTIDRNRIIDAGPKGNLSRFINHCCSPNCETQKWTVRGETRVGIFAKTSIPANTELTFNYNMETIGKEKKACHCGAVNCTGFLGIKQKEVIKKPKKLQRKDNNLSNDTSNNKTCFICDKTDTNADCTIKTCGKSYHLECLEISAKPKGKFACPKHYCNTCTKKKDVMHTCHFCLESYCASHRHNRIKFNRKMGLYLCNKHNLDENSTNPDKIKEGIA